MLALLLPRLSADSPAPTPPNTAAFAPAVQSINAFGVDVLNKAVPADNAIFSPYSIQMGLVMTYAGAAGETRKQMAKTLHYGDDAVASFVALSRELKALPAALPNGIVLLDLTIANRLFAQKGYDFLPDYLSAMKRDFDAPVEQVDFTKSPADVAKTLNDWVVEQTNDRIRDMVSPDAIPANTRLVLANAVYFSAWWHSTFSETLTVPAPFTLLDGKTRDVPTMHQETENFEFCETENFLAVGMPYTKDYFRFVAILPKGDFEKFTFTADTLKQLDKLQRHDWKMIFSMPKFRIEPPTLALADFLKAAGMPSAFNKPTGSADFSGIAPRKAEEYLYISAVLHKAFIDVNEKGTEAAAGIKAFTGGWGRREKEPEPRIVKLDRPFYFTVQHRSTGACLFLGRLVEP